MAKKVARVSKVTQQVAKAVTDTAARKIRNFDGWSNVITGLGVKAKDKLMSTIATWNRLQEDELEQIYAADELATKIVNMPVEEAFRMGYNVTGIDADMQKKIMDRVKALEVNENYAEGWIKGRLYGGACVLLVTDDFKDLSKRRNPLAKLKALNVLSRHELTTQSEDIETNILVPDYGNPKHYRFNSRVAGGDKLSEVIHASRVVRFDGAWLPDRLRKANGYWYDSVLTKVYEPLRNYNSSHDSCAATLADFSVAVFKMNNLAEMIAANDDDDVITRLSIMNLAKSISRAVVIDTDKEDFDHRTRSVTGFKEMLEKVEMRLVASTPMPHTVLLGNSPTGGLGSNGSHEQMNWYDHVKTLQTNLLKPKLLPVIQMIAREEGADPSAIDIEFNPLWLLTEKEQADVRKTQADTDKIYIEQGVVDPKEIAISRFGGDRYSTDTKIELELRKEESFKPELPIPELDPGAEESAHRAAVAGAYP